jgi:hypothetical protein
MEITPTQLKQFLTILQHRNNSFFYDIDRNRVYTRITMTPVHNGQICESQKSVYCFIRNNDGAILKAASYKAPANGVRAWLTEILVDPSRVGSTTGWLYK